MNAFHHANFEVSLFVVHIFTICFQRIKLRHSTAESQIVEHCDHQSFKNAEHSVALLSIITAFHCLVQRFRT